MSLHTDGLIFPDEETVPETYVFQLTDDTDPALLEAMDGVDVLCEDARLFRTDDITLIRMLEAEDMLEEYAEDGVVCLDTIEDEIDEMDLGDYRSAMLGYRYMEDNGITGSGIKIGVVDSGISSNFAARSSAEILPGYNFLVSADSDDRHDATDTYGHGTFVTSIICGNGIGAASGVSVLPLKCFDGKESSYSRIIEAINTAIEEECDVINLSLGVTDRYDLLEEAVQLALDSGIIVVASAGNLPKKGSTGNDEPRWPAAHEGVISVGAVDSTKAIWNKSVQHATVCTVAPCVNISGFNLSSGFNVNTGTSFSAPIVSAVAALALSVDGTLTSEDFTALLAATCEDLGEPGRDNAYGYGLINPALLLATLREDAESLILTRWDSVTGVSAYLPSPDERNVIAFYDADGRLIEAGPADSLCSFPVPDDTQRISLITASAETSAPLSDIRIHE